MRRTTLGRSVVAVIVAGGLALSATPGVASDEPTVVEPSVSAGSGLEADEPVDDPAAPAFAEAVATGEPVEVESLRDEFSQTFANPDGATLTLESFSAARFGRDEAGDLVEIDTTLVVDDEGNVRPRAAAVDLVLPSGGDETLRLGDDEGRELEFSFEGDLGAPQLDGDTATYVDVLPEVDLKITALAEGLREVYVVKTPAAAADPRLEKLSFPIATEDGAIEGRAGGGVMFIDPAGEIVFASAPAVMWDSAGEHVGLQSVSGPGGELVEDFVAPSPGDAAIEMPVRLTGDDVTVTPDVDLLADPDTVFPVYIDPTLGLDRTARLMLRSDANNQKVWQFTGSQGLGQCPTNYSSECGGTYKKRLFYEFPRGGLNDGDMVTSAEFAVANTHSVSCTAKPVELLRTGGISSGTTWPGPGSQGVMGTKSFAYGRDGCSPAGKDFEITNGPLLGAARDLANGLTQTLTFGLRAVNESEQLSWKRFGQGAVLRITFYRKPGEVGGLAVVGNAGGGCRTDPAKPLLLDGKPWFQAIVRAQKVPPNGEPQGTLRARFVLERRVSGVWQEVTSQRVPGPGDSPAGKPHGSTVSWDLRPTAVNIHSGGSLYRIRAQVESMYDDPATPNNPALIADPGPMSEPCFFQVDPDAPAAPRIASTDGLYPEEVNGNIVWGGGPGKVGDFQFTPNPVDDDPNITGYDSYLISDGGQLFPYGNGALVLPNNAGPHTLYARARDALGRPSADAAYHFNVQEDRRPVAYWHVTETSGTTIANASADVIDPNDPLDPREPVNDRTLTLSSESLIAPAGFGRRGTIDWDGFSQQDRALRFTAAGGTAVSDAYLIDTENSFSVSSWAWLEDNGADRVVVSQGNSNNPAGFDIRYVQANNAWAATWTTATGEVVRAVAQVPATPRVWTQVAAVYDKAAQTLTLNLNGRPAAAISVAGRAPVATDGRLVIGAASPAGATGFRGLVDEVQVWRKKIDSNWLARSGAYDEERPVFALAGSWDASVQATATTVADKSVFGRQPMTLDGVTKDPALGHVVLNGAGGLTTTGPVIDETGPFTVSANFLLDPAQMAQTSQARIVGQQSANGNPSWALWFIRQGVDANGDAKGVWQFGRWSQPPGQAGQRVDATTAPNHTYRVELGVETRVSAVYNPLKTGEEMCVYAGAFKLGCASYSHPVQGSGELTAGMSKVGSSRMDFLAGHLRCVNIWAGAATSDELLKNDICA